MTPFVEVAVGLPVRGTYCYALPPALGASARIGARVLVPFGARGVTGVIVRRSAAAPVEEVREIRKVLDDEPALEPELVELCLWIADYYDAPPGEVIRTALPPGTSEAYKARLVLTEHGREALQGTSEGALPASTLRLLGSVARGAKVGAVERAAMIAAGFAELVDLGRGPRARVKMVPTARLLGPPTEAEAGWMARARRRAAVMAALGSEPKPVKALGPPAVVRALAERGLAAIEERPAEPTAGADLPAPAAPLPPTPDQAAALAAPAPPGGLPPLPLPRAARPGQTPRLPP